MSNQTDVTYMEPIGTLESSNLDRYKQLDVTSTPSHLPIGTTIYFVEDNSIYEGKITSVEIRKNLYSAGTPTMIQYSVAYVKHPRSSEPYLTSVYRLDSEKVSTSREGLVNKLLANYNG